MSAAQRAPSHVATSPAEWAGLCLLLAVAAALRFYRLGHEPLWLDEAYSWWSARQPLGALASLVPTCDPEPPLYPLILKGWIALFGDGTAAVRGPTAVAGVLAVALLWGAGRAISPSVGFVAAALFAVAPFQIEFAHEARAYALVTVAFGLVLYGGLRITCWADPDAGSSSHVGVREGLGAWIALAVGGALAVWLRNTAEFVLVSLICAALAWMAIEPSARRHWRAIGVVAVAVLLAWAPYLPTYIAQARGVIAAFWIPPPTPGFVVHEIGLVLGDESPWLVGIAGVLFALGIAGLWRTGRRGAALLVACMALGPIVFTVAASLLLRPILIARVLIGIALPVYVAVAVAVTRLPGKAWRAAAFAALVAASLLANYDLLSQEARKEPWNEVVRELVAMTPSDALVLLLPSELELPLAHALEQAHVARAMRGVPRPFPAPGLDVEYPTSRCVPVVEDAGLAALARALEGRRTVALIHRMRDVYDPDDKVPEMLARAGFVQVAKREFPSDKMLELYERR
ncbi:MAG: glycosyltransferase family 39 protein [Burkholderiales bacterium]|nr:glycosyltransferase family 39 protein [Burkholderiales bacterium]